MIALLTVLVLASGAGPVGADVPDEHVVARVTPPGAEAIEITAGRLRRYAATRTDRSPRQALGDLVEFELIAADARARGLAEAPEVRDAANAAAVMRYLRTDFEVTWQPLTVPEGMLTHAYRRKRGYFHRAEGRAVAHLLVTQEAPAEAGEAPVKQRPPDAATAALAEALAERIRAEIAADPPPDQDAFLARVADYEPAAAEHGLVLVAEPLRTFSRAGSGLDPDFAAAAFEIGAEGELSPVTETPYGYHVLRLDHIFPERNVAFEDAVPELRDGLVVPLRREKLRELTDALAREHGAVVNFRPLEQVESRLTVTPGVDAGAPPP